MGALLREAAAGWMRLRALVQLQLLRRTPVVVYQMGKVGSRSVYDSLRSAGGIFVAHVHRMNPGTIAAVAEQYRLSGRRAPRGDVLGPSLYHHAVRRGRPLEVVTLVRDPVARNLSAFFENLDAFTDIGPDRLREDVPGLIELFLAAYPHEVPLTWFDRELRATLGVDIFAVPFPAERGWVELTGSGHRVLVLKLEAGDAVMQQAIGAFLGRPDFRLRRTNVGVEKPYARLYDEVKHAIRLPEEYLERMYTSRLCTHFYPAVEIAAFRNRWQRGASDAR